MEYQPIINPSFRDNYMKMKKLGVDPPPITADQFTKITSFFGRVLTGLEKIVVNESQV